ncbi:MAG: thermonuclease family protein [Candidatus Shapirobacteria bacterium]|jgi:endonuclease YncB( thermonuclease family)
MKKWVVLAGLALAIAAGVNFRWNRVKEVIDGDTFTLGNGQRVRLLGIDAPEMEWCGGPEAKTMLEELVLGRMVRLGEVRGDRYGRVLGLAYVGNTFINEKMLRAGAARWDGNLNSEEKLLRAASDFAREKKIGIFSDKCRPEVNREKPECLIKGNIDKTTGRKMYHFPGCIEFQTTIVEKDLGEEWFCTEKDAAAAGYVKSEHCPDNMDSGI